jgi:hypothetical protein
MSKKETIPKRIELQYDIAEELLDEIQLIANACPARLNDPRHFRGYQRRRI